MIAFARNKWRPPSPSFLWAPPPCCSSSDRFSSLKNRLFLFFLDTTLTNVIITASTRTLQVMDGLSCTSSQGGPDDCWCVCLTRARRICCFSCRESLIQYNRFHRNLKDIT